MISEEKQRVGKTNTYINIYIYIYVIKTFPYVTETKYD